MSVILQLQIMVQFCRSYLMDQPRVVHHDCLEKCVFPGKTYSVGGAIFGTDNISSTICLLLQTQRTKWTHF